MLHNINDIRAQFPSLAQKDEDKPRVYFDNPAGTQVPKSVANAVAEVLLEANANTGGFFPTAIAAQSVKDEARTAMVDLLGAASVDEIVFGQNMTSLVIALSHAIEKQLKPGDEIIVTKLDHDANVWPWVEMAGRAGASVRYLDFNPATGELDQDDYASVLTDKTAFVAVGYASNLLGTINPVREMIAMAHEVGATTFIDAVHYAPHGPIDVQELNCDFLACSAYKFFGTHQGILYGRKALLDALAPDNVRPALAYGTPGKFETGTQSHEGLAGITAAVNYLASLTSDNTANSRRAKLLSALTAIRDYEADLATQLVEGLKAIEGVTVYGISDPDRYAHRVATTSFTMAQHDPETIARKLAEKNIFVWDGHSYAMGAVDTLGLMDSGGVVRVGPCHYNTTDEIERLLDAVRELSA